jgi:zinc protease
MHVDDGVPPPAPAEEVSPRAVHVGHHKDRAQSHVVMGVRGLRLTDPDRHALEVLTSVLSGQGGRLFYELRDKQSLCYSVGAYQMEGIEPGSFTVYIGTSPDKVDRAKAEILSLLDGVQNNGVTELEISKAKRYLSGTYAISLQRVGSRATSMALNELYGLGYLSHQEHIRKLQAVTGADVLRVAKRVLSQPMVTSVVGPAKTVA